MRFLAGSRAITHYIKESPYVDVVWSDKLGYVILNIDPDKFSIETEPIIIESAEELCEELLHEISNDVMENTGHEFTFAEAPPDIRLEIESRFGVYLDQLPQYRYIADDMFKSKS